MQRRRPRGERVRASAPAGARRPSPT
jgi:hypothetical protein